MIRTHYGQHGQDCFGCRVRTVQLAPSRAFQPHYNHAVGQYVSTDSEFRDALKRCSDRSTAETGIPHDFQPRYPGDIPAPPYREADGVLDTRARNLSDIK